MSTLGSVNIGIHWSVALIAAAISVGVRTMILNPIKLTRTRDHLIKRLMLYGILLGGVDFRKSVV